MAHEWPTLARQPASIMLLLTTTTTIIILCTLTAVSDGLPAQRPADDSAKSDHIEMDLPATGAPQFVRPHRFTDRIDEHAGLTVRMQCPATGTPAPTVTWTKDAAPIERIAGIVQVKSRSFAIVLEDLQAADAGNYTCSVCNVHACIQHTRALHVIDNNDHNGLANDGANREPEILSQNGVSGHKDEDDDNDADTANDEAAEDEDDTEPDDYPEYLEEDNEAEAAAAAPPVMPHLTADWEPMHLRPVGATFRLKCKAAGRPEPNITWSRDSGRLPPNAQPATGVLKLASVKQRDAGNYTCTACNTLGCVAFVTQLRVRGGALASMQGDDPHGADDADSDYVDHTVAIPAGHDPASAPSSAAAAAGAESAAGGATAASSTTPAPGLPQFVKYSTFNRLLARPSGNMVRMKCPAVGNPTPTIAWTKGDGQAIDRQMGGVKIRQYSIVLEDLIPSDSGNYTCNVCNVHGCINYTMKLEVNDRFPAKPIFKEGFPKNLTVLRNSTTSIQCPVLLADLAVHVQWAKYHAFNETDTRDSTSVKYLETDLDNPEVYELNNITFADEGWYTCIASNSLGATVGSAYLRVVDKFPDEPVLAKMDANPLFRFVGVTLFASFLLIMAIIVIVQFRRIKHEKLMKHRAMETVHQWTKKIIIVKPSDDEMANGSGAGAGGSGDEAGSGGAMGHADAIGMQIPIVRIEKQRTTLVQQSSNSEFNEYEFPLDSNWEWSRNQLTLGQTLGEGAFGRVVMAEAHGMEKGAGSIVVAVKMVKEGHTDTDMASLVREMEVMKMIGKHINILNLLGCCSQDGPLYVIVEYAPHGNLKDFLKKHRPLSEFEVGIHHGPNRKEVLQKDLISIAFQVARGMEYLASRRCIHRDLAARNVLVSDDYVVKIADFGLARDIQESEYYRKYTNGRLPIKWMAPESLRDKFYDSQSDVWSFGVLLWEIMTYGEQPYPQVFSSEHLYEFLREGNRMEKPSRCSMNIYMLMRQCWNWNSHERPTFTEIVENLDQILGANLNDEYLDVGIPRLETPPSSDDEHEDDDDDGDSDAETLHEQSLLRYHHR